MKDRRLTQSSWGFEFYNQWAAIISTLFTGDRYNWYDFTLIEIGFEKCNFTGRYELDFSLLGFCFTVQYVYDQTFNEEMQKRLSEVDLEDKS